MKLEYYLIEKLVDYVQIITIKGHIRMTLTYYILSIYFSD